MGAVGLWMLGFLSEGSFFGEAAVLGSGSGSELRSRTVVSVVDSELCFLTSHDMEEMKKRYPELEARLNR
jgi:CRP-like cAMP-binding protein